MTFHSRFRRISLGAAGLAGLTALAGGLVAAPPASGAGTPVVVTIKDYAYTAPDHPLTVGDSVTWTNQDTAPHDATTTKAPVAFKSPVMKTGESWTYQFTEPGTYEYFCSLHPQMIASLAVAAAQPRQPGSQEPGASASSGVKEPAAKPEASKKGSSTRVDAGAAPASTKGTKEGKEGSAAKSARASARSGEPATKETGSATPASAEPGSAAAKATGTNRPTAAKAARTATKAGAKAGTAAAKPAAAEGPKAVSVPERASGDTAVKHPATAPAPGAQPATTEPAVQALPATSSGAGVDGLQPVLWTGGIVVGVAVLALLAMGFRPQGG